MTGLQLILLLFSAIALTSANPETRLLFPEYCLYHGYPTETHIIRTKDFYSLKFFRLQGILYSTQPKIRRSKRGTKWYTFSMVYKIQQIPGS